MGVLCRLNSEMFTLFKDAQTEEELLKSINGENSGNSSVKIILDQTHGS